MRNLVIDSLLVLTLWNFKSTLSNEIPDIIVTIPCNGCEGEVICEGSCECVEINVDGSLTTYKCAPEIENPKICVGIIDPSTIKIIPAPLPDTDSVIPIMKFNVIPCPNCPEDCKRESTISSLLRGQSNHGSLLGPGLCLKDGFEVKYQVKNSCNILTIKRKGNKKFCIHDLHLKIGGKNCYDFTLSIKGKKKVTNWCLFPSGNIMIPSDSPLYNGQKTKKLVIKVCKSNCKVLSWILTACVEDQLPDIIIEPSEIGVPVA